MSGEISKRVSAMPIPDRGVASETSATAASAASSTALLSPQQQAVLDWVSRGAGSALVEAVAGSGKTTTAVEACKRMRGRAAFTAFNKKTADEIKRKTSGLSNVRVATFHSFGFSAWRRQAPNCQTDAQAKWRRMMETVEIPFAMRSAVGKMVSIAKQSVVGRLWSPEDEEKWRQIIQHFDILFSVDEMVDSEATTIERLIGYGREAVQWSRQSGSSLIDFDDMIWLPLVEGVPVEQYDWVLVDEAQDTNPARRMLAERMLRSGGRSLWVGDRHQAIYGFTGADADAVDQIVDTFECALLPLTVTFRCSKTATRFAQTWVPHITAHEANEEGSVTQESAIEFTEHRILGHPVPDAGPRASELRPGDAILCRNTRPLVSLAFELIRAGIGCHVEGRDIGKHLDRLASKWSVDTVPALLTNLEAYRQKEIEKLMARDAGFEIDSVNDRVDTLIALTEGSDTVLQVRMKIDSMFQDSGDGNPRAVVLSTVHKAKGREWDRVFILGFGKYMPSRWARQPWEQDQERNLMYVAATRTRRDLVLTEAREY